MTFYSHTGISDWATKVIENLNGTNLIELTLDKNAIYNVQPLFSRCLPKLEILSLGENYLYERSELTLDFYNLSHLVGLNISWQQRENYDSQRRTIPNKITDVKDNNFLTHGQPTKSIGTIKDVAHFTPNVKSHQPKDYGKMHRNDILRFEAHHDHQADNVGDIHICEEGMACPIRLPKYFKWVEMSHFGLHLPIIPELVILTNSTLDYVGIAYSGVQTFRRPIYCAFGTIPQVTFINTPW